MPPGEELRAFARHGTTMAIFLSAARTGQMVAELRAGGYPDDTPAAVVYRATWPDEQVIRGTLATIAAPARAARLTKQALILVGPAVEPGPDARRSDLYRPEVGHLYRKAAPPG
jgi:precorrin-4/cobalt-precorrin-4 C11-methyltransferase